MGVKLLHWHVYPGLLSRGERKGWCRKQATKRKTKNQWSSRWQCTFLPGKKKETAHFERTHSKTEWIHPCISETTVKRKLRLNWNTKDTHCDPVRKTACHLPEEPHRSGFMVSWEKRLDNWWKIEEHTIQWWNQGCFRQTLKIYVWRKSGEA